MEGGRAGKRKSAGFTDTYPETVSSTAGESKSAGNWEALSTRRWVDRGSWVRTK